MKHFCLSFNGLLLLIGLVGCNHIPYGNNKAAGRYYNIRGFKMYCETYGAGKPLLMIHGNNGSINTFARIIPAFADKYRVIVADSRSQGRSTDTKDSLSYEMMADDYAALLDRLHLDSVYIIGWSDGGINALLLAMRHPGKVKMLAASGASLWPDVTSINPGEYLTEKKKYDELKSVTYKTDNAVNEVKLLKLELEQPHIALQSLRSIKCPSLIICGDHDIIRREHTLLIHQNIAGSGLWVVPNAGHGTLFEQRRKFINHVSDFFAGGKN